MHLNQVTIKVTDIEKSKQFYTKLGLNMIVNSPHYARFIVPGNQCTFSLDKADVVIPGTTTVYFECNPLDKTVNHLKQSGFTFEHDPVDKPWLWREAYLKDPDGYTICLFFAGENRLNLPWKIT